LQSCHKLDEINIDESKEKVVLVGNPNVGKSIFFNYLTESYVSVSNYPGTTLDISSGEFKDYIVLDTPGVYGVSSFNDEEKVARDIILSADIIVNIVDAVHLERDLFLTQQLIDMDKKVIVALNMMDEAETRGLDIDIDELKKKLGVEVIPTVAVDNKGLSMLADTIQHAKKGNKSLSAEMENKLVDISKKIKNKADSLLILEGDQYVAKHFGVDALAFRETIYNKRRKRVNEIVEEVITKIEKNNTIGDKIGSLLLRPLSGIPILLVILYA